MPLYPEKSLEQHAAEMARMAEVLRPHTRSPEDDAVLAVLKARDVTVDGYLVQVYYSVEDRDGVVLHSVRVVSKDVPYLPFWVHGQRVARTFLGDRELALSEFIVMGRKMYVWCQGRDPRTDEPVPILLHKDARRASYDGLEYQTAPVTQFVIQGNG